MSAQSLPVELWRRIFRHATRVSLLLDTDWRYDIDDCLWAGWEMPTPYEGSDLGAALASVASDETKRTIVLVCRAWRDIGVEFLYEIIEIPHDTRRRSRLADAMEQSASGSSVGHGWWTKQIAWRDFDLSDSFKNATSILKSCHNLEVLTVICGVAPPDVQVALAERLQSRFSHSLRRIELWVHRPNHDSAQFIKHMPNIPLKSIGITAFYTYISDLPFSSQFHTISTLTIYLPRWIQPAGIQWFLPNLRNLSIDSFKQDDVPTLVPLFERHQHTINYLHLRPTDQECDFLPLISCTPNVRSLTFPLPHLRLLSGLVKRNGGQARSLPGITHVGIFKNKTQPRDPPIQLRETPIIDDIDGLLEAGLFPQLRVVRLLYPMKPDDEENWNHLSLILDRRGVCFNDMHGRAISTR